VITALLILLAYALGATPTSYWVGRGFFGLDLREHGSGNLGATNTFRILGAKAALPVVLVDVLKGWLPVWLFPQLQPEAATWWAMIFGSMAIVGHMFSFWVGFRGGKGVATSAGAFLALAPWAVLLGLFAWVVPVWITRIVSLGSICAAVVLPIGVWLFPHGSGPELLPFTVAVAAFVIWAHRSNIGRLLRGEELAFRRSAEGDGSPAPSSAQEPT
jgi:glycerol-3-phosphate acyltransferase PlsY